MIGVISAMDEELLEVIKNLNTEKIVFNKFEFYKTEISGKDVVLGICGIGKVNAAMFTQTMIDHFGTEFIINIGVAGSMDEKVGIGDLVIGTDYIYHDFDCTLIGYKVGEIPRFNERFRTEEKYVNIAYEKAKKVLNEGKIFKGRIATGDVFVASKDSKNKIKADVNPLCCEMESAAIVHVCHANGVKYLALRSISDNANDEADVDFDTFVLESAKIVKSIIIDFIEAI